MTRLNRQQWLTLAAGGVLALYVLDALVLSPLLETWKSRAASIQELRQSIQAGQMLLERDSLTRSRWSDLQNLTLPTNASQAEQQVLQAFDQWSRRSRIAVTSVKPQWKRGTTDDYSTLECRVDAAGDLLAITEFLYEVESSPLALRIESIELAARDANGQQLALGLVVSGLRLSPMEAN